MQIEVGTYKAVVKDGLLQLLQAAERYLPSVTITPTGTTVAAVPYSSVSLHKVNSPVLSANWAGEGYANVDLDAGWQRWNGTKSMRWIRNGLRKAGFSKRQVDSIFRELRKAGPQDSVGRCW